MFSEATRKESKDLYINLKPIKNKAIGKVKLIAQLRSILKIKN